MENKFCISTLTHSAPNRDKFLRLTIKTFLENTSLPKVEWYIHCNGFDQSIVDVVEEAKQLYSDKIVFHFTQSENNGVGFGINRLNEQTEQYEYVLFLEGDWITIPTDENWLNTCLSYMDSNSGVDQILLRRYLHDVDDRQFGFGYWIREDNINFINEPFLHLKKKEYTNNPYIRRNKRFYEAEIFPLQEFIIDGQPTELKDRENWGQAELKAEPLGYKLHSVYLMMGTMVHCDHFPIYDDWETLEQKKTKCIHYNTCKYGYLFSNERFCGLCIKEASFSDLERHNQLYERTYY